MGTRQKLRLSHSFPAECPPGAELLILGSFPSEKSREEGFYYAHPQNRFWPLLSAIYGEEIPRDIPAKKAFLARHKLALYDVIDSCVITGSQDRSIKDVVPIKLHGLPPYRRILLNGRKATLLFQRYLTPLPTQEVVSLPSTSPANAAFSLQKLLAIWGPFLH